MSNGIMDANETRHSWDPGRHLLYGERARNLQAEVFAGSVTESGRFLARWLSKGVQGVVNAVRKRRTIKELARLDDRTLRDIGVERSRIPEFVRALNARGTPASHSAETPASHSAETSASHSAETSAPHSVDISASHRAEASAPGRPSDRGDAVSCEGPHSMAA